MPIDPRTPEQIRDLICRPSADFAEYRPPRDYLGQPLRMPRPAPGEQLVTRIDCFVDALCGACDKQDWVGVNELAGRIKDTAGELQALTADIGRDGLQ